MPSPRTGRDPAGRYRSLRSPFHLYYGTDRQKVQLIFQLIQRTQQHADVPLVQKMPAARYPQTRCGSRLPSSHAVPERWSMCPAPPDVHPAPVPQRAFCAALRCFRHRCWRFHLRAGRCGDWLSAVKGGQLRWSPLHSRIFIRAERVSLSPCWSPIAKVGTASTTRTA